MAKKKVAFSGMDDAERVLKGIRNVEELVRRGSLDRPHRPGTSSPVLVRLTDEADTDGLYPGVFTYFDPDTKTLEDQTDNYQPIHIQCLVKFREGNEPADDTINEPEYFFLGTPVGPDPTTGKMVVVAVDPSVTAGSISPTAAAGCAIMLALDPERDQVTFEILPGATGRCLGVTSGISVIGEYVTDSWLGQTLETDTGDWDARYYLPTCSSPAKLSLSKTTSDGTTTVCGVQLGCGYTGNPRVPYADFVFSGEALCGGEPGGPCERGMFIVRVKCRHVTVACSMCAPRQVADTLYLTFPTTAPAGFAAGPTSVWAVCLAGRTIALTNHAFSGVLCTNPGSGTPANALITVTCVTNGVGGFTYTGLVLLIQITNGYTLQIDATFDIASDPTVCDPLMEVAFTSYTLTPGGAQTGALATVTE